MQGVTFHPAGSAPLAIVVRANASSASKYNFLTDTEQPLQLGVNFYQEGDTIPRHAHVPRSITVTTVQEALLIAEGTAKVRLFDDERAEVETVVLHAGDLILLLGGGHGLEFLQNTKIVEIKQGPYDGKAVDKVVFE